MAEQSSNIPLTLETGWFANYHTSEIPYLQQNPDFALVNRRASELHSSKGPVTVTVVFACRKYADLSRTFIKLEWDTADALHTVKSKQKHFPPPEPVGDADLQQFSGTYGPRIVKFCEDAFASGFKVGDGECWTLAEKALESVPDCMTSFGVFHGQSIFSRDAKVSNGNPNIVQPGDIIQYTRAKFEEHEGGKLVRIVTNGAPNHTSVIVAVIGSGVWEVLEQGGSLSKIRRKLVKVEEMVEGKIVVYRPVPKAWLGSLVPEWRPEYD